MWYRISHDFIWNHFKTSWESEKFKNSNENFQFSHDIIRTWEKQLILNIKYEFSLHTKKYKIRYSLQDFFASCRTYMQYDFHIPYFSYQSHITYLHKKIFIHFSLFNIHSEMKTFIQRCQKNGNKSTWMKDIYIFLSYTFLYLDKNVCFHIPRYQSHS